MSNILTHLRAVLTREFDALTQGEFDQMDEIYAQKTKLIEDLQDIPASLPTDLMDDLRMLITRNNALYEAALDGFAVVRHRLEALQDVQGGLMTYGDTGQRQVMNGAAKTRDSRA